MIMITEHFLKKDNTLVQKMYYLILKKSKSGEQSAKFYLNIIKIFFKNKNKKKYILK